MRPLNSAKRTNTVGNERTFSAIAIFVLRVASTFANLTGEFRSRSSCAAAANSPAIALLFFDHCDHAGVSAQAQTGETMRVTHRRVELDHQERSGVMSWKERFLVQLPDPIVVDLARRRWPRRGGQDEERSEPHVAKKQPH